MTDTVCTVNLQNLDSYFHRISYLDVRNMYAFGDVFPSSNQ